MLGAKETLNVIALSVEVQWLYLMSGLSPNNFTVHLFDPRVTRLYQPGVPVSKTGTVQD